MVNGDSFSGSKGVDRCFCVLLRLVVGARVAQVLAAVGITAAFESTDLVGCMGIAATDCFVLFRPVPLPAVIAISLSVCRAVRGELDGLAGRIHREEVEPKGSALLFHITAQVYSQGFWAHSRVLSDSIDQANSFNSSIEK